MVKYYTGDATLAPYEHLEMEDPIYMSIWARNKGPKKLNGSSWVVVQSNNCGIEDPEADIFITYKIVMTETIAPASKSRPLIGMLGILDGRIYNVPSWETNHAMRHRAPGLTTYTLRLPGPIITENLGAFIKHIREVHISSVS